MFPPLLTVMTASVQENTARSRARQAHLDVLYPCPTGDRLTFSSPTAPSPAAVVLVTFLGRARRREVCCRARAATTAGPAEMPLHLEGAMACAACSRHFRGGSGTPTCFVIFWGARVWPFRWLFRVSAAARAPCLTYVFTEQCLYRPRRL